MLTPTSRHWRARFWLFLVPLILIALWLYAFYPEMYHLYLYWFNPQALDALQISDDQLAKDVALLTLNFITFPVYLVLALWAVSQFVLPIKLPSERLKVFNRLIRFILGRHGPAVFIQEGQIQGDIAELQSSRPGVAFVDLSSAVILERQPFVSVTGGGLTAWERQRRTRRRRATQHASASRGNMLVRVAGPGVVFTEAGERIRGVVSLRRQFSIRPNVHSITRDGFEVSAHIITIFTLGEPPDVLRVGYLGERAQDLRVLRFDDRTGLLRSAQDELDEEDKNEIHRQYIQASRFHEEINPEQPEGSHFPASYPYDFNEERVFKAVYGEAHHPNAGEVEHWRDLPGLVAVETFHNLIALYHYADLYQPKDPERFPFAEEFRPEFLRRVKNQGILSYQLVVRQDGQPLKVGESYNPDHLIVHPARPLTNGKILRDRGIKVIAAMIPELRPVNPAVRQQLLDYWRSHWQRERDIHLAAYDYEEIRVRAASRVQAQNGIVKSLTEIIQDHSISQEAVALRLLQAVESYAREPMTEKLVPLETMNTLRFLIQRVGSRGNPLLPEQQSASTGPRPTFGGRGDDDLGGEGGTSNVQSLR